MAKEMFIEKSVVINKDVHEVFEFLKKTRHQDQFSVWNMKDPAMNKTYTGTDGTKGFIYTWNSKDKNVGAGEQEIKNLIEDSRIDYELRFKRPMQNTAQSSFIIDKTHKDVTSVTWTFSSPTKFPMSLLAPIFKNMLGKQIDQGLQNLKTLLEHESA
jgi:uncharacterized membrane protein